MSQDDDIPSGYGSLGGLGAEEHDTIKTKVVGEGVLCTLKCDRCGTGLRVTVPWEELIVMSQAKLPPNNSWRHDGYNGCFMPNSQCRCGDAIRLGLTPDECQRHIRSGIAAGKVRADAVQDYIQRIKGGAR